MKNRNKNKNKKSESRRAFVQKTAIASGILLSSPIGLEGMVRINENPKLKLALVGCGGRGSGAAVQALTADENVELVAMADAFADRIERSLNGIQKHFDGEEKQREKMHRTQNFRPNKQHSHVQEHIDDSH